MPVVNIIWCSAIARGGYGRGIARVARLVRPTCCTARAVLSVLMVLSSPERRTIRYLRRASRRTECSFGTHSDWLKAAVSPLIRHDRKHQPRGSREARTWD